MPSSICRSWTIVSSVASCAPRELSPDGGIQTSVSHCEEELRPLEIVDLCETPFELRK